MAVNINIITSRNALHQPFGEGVKYGYSGIHLCDPHGDIEDKVSLLKHVKHILETKNSNSVKNDCIVNDVSRIVMSSNDETILRIINNDSYNYAITHCSHFESQKDDLLVLDFVHGKVMLSDFITEDIVVEHLLNVSGVDNLIDYLYGERDDLDAA